MIKETLRHHPPATGLLRKMTKDQEIGGYKIPADVAILVQGFVYKSSTPLFFRGSSVSSKYNKVEALM